MTPTDPIQKAPPPKPLAPRVPGPTQQTKEDSLRRLSIWKNGVAVASVAGFLAITGALIDQHSGTTSAAPAANVAQVAPLLTGTAAATATPPSTTPLKTDPATGSSPPHRGKAATIVPSSAKQAATATTAATATPAPSVTPAATATATAPATAVPAATATALPTATPATQNGGYSLGNSSTAQQPVAVATVS